MSAWVLCSSSDLILGDELDEVRVKSGLLLNLVFYIVHAGTAGCQGANLLNGRVLYVEVLIQILSVTPYIALEKFNALHVKEYLNGIGHGLAVRWRYLNHPQPGTSLHQIEEVYVTGSEGHMNHLFIWVEIWDLSSFANNSKSHIFSLQCSYHY